jgi:hypothetical protein
MARFRDWMAINRGFIIKRRWNMNVIRFLFFTIIPLIISANCLAQALSSQAKDGRTILLRGTVIGVVPEISHGSSFATVKVSVKLEFLNISVKPLLLLLEKSPICVEAIITKTANPEEGDNILYDQYRGASINFSPEWKKLREALNQSKPPTDLIKIVKPGESWINDNYIIFRPSLKLEKYTIDLPAVSWNLLLQSSPAWLRLKCELWPFNVEPDPRSSENRFGHELQQRWHQYGILQLDTITSEPIAIDFRPQ